MQNIGLIVPFVSKAAPGLPVANPASGAAFADILGPATDGIEVPETTARLAADKESPPPADDNDVSESAEVDPTEAGPIVVPNGLPPLWPQPAPASDPQSAMRQREPRPINVHAAAPPALVRPPPAALADVIPVRPDVSQAIRTSAEPLIFAAAPIQTAPDAAPESRPIQKTGLRDAPAPEHPLQVPIGARSQTGSAISSHGPAKVTSVLSPPTALLHVVSSSPPSAQAAPLTSPPAADPGQPQTPDLRLAKAEPGLTTRPGMTVRAYVRTQNLAIPAATPVVTEQVLPPGPAPRVHAQDGMPRDLHGASLSATGSPPPETGPAAPPPATNVAIDAPIVFAAGATIDTGADAVAMPGAGAPPPQSVPFGTNTVPGAAIPMAALPQAVATALKDDPARQVELRLDPPELGSVRFQLDQSNAGLVVTIIAERPETLDLMRRHADQLLADLRQTGFQGASLNFGSSQGQGGSGQNGSGPGGQGSTPPSGQTTPTPAPSFVTPTPPPPRAAKGGLNLRL
jgi:flagellar hook-length control protein FliK